MRTLTTSSIFILLSLLASSCDMGAFPAGRARGSAITPGTDYRVRAGESLFSIADRAYGNGMEWETIWRANPWIDPERIEAGQVLYIPPQEEVSRQAPAVAYEDSSGGDSRGYKRQGVARHSDPGGGMVGLNVLGSLSVVTTKTLLGLPLHQVLLALLLCFLGHAFFQGLLVWLGANLTFVKEATLKKSMKAVFLTETLTFSTLIAIGGIAVVILYLGAEPAASGGELFPALETFLRKPSGAAATGLILLLLYGVLSLRFLPQVFSLPVPRAVSLMALAIVLPHFLGLYLLGQRTGLIH